MPRVALRDQVLEAAQLAALRHVRWHHRVLKQIACDASSDELTDTTDTDTNTDSNYLSSSSSSQASLSSMSYSSFSSLSLPSSSAFSASSSAPSASSSIDNHEYIRALRAWFVRSLSTFAAMHLFIRSSRVLFLNCVWKLSQLPLVLRYFKIHDPARFRRNVRVEPATFDALVSLIEDHEVFQNESLNDQAPVEEQLAIALHRFGHFGSAASNEEIAQWAGYSAGFVTLCTRRIITVFNSLHDLAIQWPTAAEKRAASDWVESRSCHAWRRGYAMVDGTLVPLFAKPGHFGTQFFDRKSNYSLNVQLITLPNLRIIDYVLGPTGSMHDSTAFKSSATFVNHAALFPNSEWLWADSAYGVTEWCVSPYKRPAALLRANAKFNYHVSCIRIRSEHAVGALKGRFQSLRGLRQYINTREDHEAAVEWIRTCLILHNLILHHEPASDDLHEYEWFLDDIPMPDGEADAFVWDGQPLRARGDIKRRLVQEALFRELYQ